LAEALARILPAPPPTGALEPLSRRPRVAVDLRALVRAPTGIGVYTLELLRELARAGELDLLGLAQREPAAGDEIRALGIPVEVRDTALGVAWQQLVLPGRLAAGDVDLFWSPLLTLPWRVAPPAVVTLHDLALLHVPETMTLKVRWSLLPFLRRSLERADRIVVGTDRVARELARAFPEASGKARVVPHGVADRYRPAAGPDEVASIRARWGAPEGYFLAVGTLEPRKNLELALEAWPFVRAEPAGENARLLLAGPPGWKDARLERRIAELEPHGVRRLGRVGAEELAELYRGALALLYPSRYEGFGLPVAEALASGVPAVVADSTSPAEVAGPAGATCDPDAPEALAGLLLRWLESPAELARLAEIARERGRRFSWRASAAAHTEVFREALAERVA
jgi:alpha-1,3-rhamnosyl/mannosyltransferase